jgi:hypothetical protein
LTRGPEKSSQKQFSEGYDFVGKGTAPEVAEKLANAGSTVEERRFSAA